MNLVNTLGNHRVLRLKVNTLGNDYVVGDIHGHVSRLLAQLDELNFDRAVDRLICVGDLVDRGPESDKAIELLAQPWFFSVLGNHEYFMLSGLKYGNSKHKMLWLQNGGDWIATSDPSRWTQWFDLLSSLPIAIEVEVNTESGFVVNRGADKLVGVVHADFPGFDWQQLHSFDERQLEKCLWSRSQFKGRSEHVVAGIDAIYHGHSINGTANDDKQASCYVQLGNRFYIEPGAFNDARFVIEKLA
jgi:serine/threonine protein phosphatase 1